MVKPERTELTTTQTATKRDEPPGLPASKQLADIDLVTASSSQVLPSTSSIISIVDQSKNSYSDTISSQYEEKGEVSRINIYENSNVTSCDQTKLKLEAYKKRLTEQSMQMRSSRIECSLAQQQQQQPENEQIQGCIEGGSCRWTNVITGVESCLSSNLNCHPSKSSLSQVEGATAVEGGKKKGHKELVVEWTKAPSLAKRLARLGGSSRSLCIRTGLVKSLKRKDQKKETETTTTTTTVFKSFTNHSSPSNYSGDVSKGDRESGCRSKGSCAYDEFGFITTENKTLRSNNKSNISTSLSCHSILNSRLPVEQQDEYGTRNSNDSSVYCKLVNRSSNINSNLSPQLNSNCKMSASGYLAKNKYIIEDKMRKQQQQKTGFKCSGEPMLENRRSTYCSSIGAIDLNYDSSYSSVINCSESNNTCAMNRLSSRESNDKQENLDDLHHHHHHHHHHHKHSSDDATTVNGSSKKSNQLTDLNNIKKRENWKNIEFLLAVIGFAVDLGNVWRFPYICYKNGGGAFLIPYTVMFILGGLPIFYLEMSLGQYFSSGCLTVWRRVCPLAKGIGYAMCLLNFYTGLYYNTIISWAVFFFVESFTNNLPWTSCNNLWNSPDCRTIDQRQALKTNSTPITQLQNQQVYFSSPTKDYFEREVLQVHLSTGIDDLGFIRKPLAIYLAIVFVFIYFAIWKGVKSTGKAVWVTALLPYFVLIPLLIRGVFLEGAWLGIRYYLYPEWGKIIAIDVWVEAAKQIYFSLGPGFGTLMALSSYNKFNHNCRKDALIAASVNYFASFISGLVIFAVLGYMATIENVSVEDVATEGPGLVFQVYPEGLATMQFSSMWSVLFFIMVITLGIDSTFGGLESVITGLCDEYPLTLRAHRGKFIGLLIILIYLCSLPTTTYGGNYVIYVLESYGTSLSLLFIVLVETIIVCWLYGADRFCKNLEEMYGETPGPYWRICWKYISPTILILIFFAACSQELDKYHVLTNGNYTYPGWAPTIGLLMTASSVCCIPIYAIYHLRVKTIGNTFYERLKIAIRPIDIDQKAGNEIYVDAPTDKIRDEHRIHLDAVI